VKQDIPGFSFADFTFFALKHYCFIESYFQRFDKQHGQFTTLWPIYATSRLSCMVYLSAQINSWSKPISCS